MPNTISFNGDAWRTINPLSNKAIELRSDLNSRRIEANSTHEIGEAAVEHRITQIEDKEVLVVKAYLDNQDKRAWIDVEIDLLDDIDFLVKASKLLHKKALKLKDRTAALDNLDE